MRSKVQLRKAVLSVLTASLVLFMSFGYAYALNQADDHWDPTIGGVKIKVLKYEWWGVNYIICTLGAVTKDAGGNIGYFLPAHCSENQTGWEIWQPDWQWWNWDWRIASVDQVNTLGDAAWGAADQADNGQPGMWDPACTNNWCWVKNKTWWVYQSVGTRVYFHSWNNTWSRGNILAKYICWDPDGDGVCDLHKAVITDNDAYHGDSGSPVHTHTGPGNNIYGFATAAGGGYLLYVAVDGYEDTIGGQEVWIKE